MYIRPIFSALIFLLFFIPASAQKNSIKKNIIKPVIRGTAKTACDCKDAVKISLNKITTYGPTVPPVGFGSVQEITSKNKFDKSAFEEEHNSAWYSLDIKYDGEFGFEIIPQDTADDYDFLLYKYTDSNFCEALQKKHLKPIRSNLSRASQQTRGITGLSSDAKNEFVGKGIGEAYSKSVEVKKGEKYILVLDNVYEGGKGHIINFNYIKQVEISGTVLNEDSIPVKAEISLTDNKGTVVKQINTENDGKYTINAGLKENLDYTLAFSSDSSFVQAKTLNTKNLKQAGAFNDIRTILPKLKKGMKVNMNCINFFGGLAILLPASISSVEALYKLMKKNKQMVIRIEGHVNGSTRAKVEAKIDYQILSEKRAETVFLYLVSMGIEKERISTIGYGGKKMLYPDASDEAKQSANRRVEINVVSIK